MSPIFIGMNNIKCAFCETDIHPKALAGHLKAHHSVNFYDYVCNHLDDFRQFGWTECVICGKVTRSRGSKKGATCSKECLAQHRKTWVGELSPRYGATLSAETKAKIGKSNSKPNEKIRGDNNPAKRPEVRKKISRTRIDKGVAAGPKNGMFGKTHTPEAIEKIMTHRPMNKLEKMVADELDRLGIKYTFQFFINDGSICKSYDFKITDQPTILEVDGDFWHGNPNTKYHHVDSDKTRENDWLKEKMAANRGYRIVRLWESDIKRDISIVESRLKDASFHIYSQ